jgi:cadmium resistance protein CadD (predicted permease)
MECVYFLPGVIGIVLGIWALVSDWRDKLREEERQRKLREKSDRLKM